MVANTMLWKLSSSQNLTQPITLIKISFLKTTAGSLQCFSNSTNRIWEHFLSTFLEMAIKLQALKDSIRASELQIHEEIENYLYTAVGPLVIMKVTMKLKSSNFLVMLQPSQLNALHTCLWWWWCQQALLQPHKNIYDCVQYIILDKWLTGLCIFLCCTFYYFLLMEKMFTIKKYAMLSAVLINLMFYLDKGLCWLASLYLLDLCKSMMLTQTKLLNDTFFKMHLTC